MSTPYDPPLSHIRWALSQAVEESQLAEVIPDLLSEEVEAILEGAARFAREVLSPLNAVGDRMHSHCEAGGVRTPPGFTQAYRRFREDGWTAVTGPAEFGGMQLPALLGVALGEMWAAANLAFAMCPELAIGATILLRRHGEPRQISEYLPQLVNGESTASMALSEPQAGSDLSLVRTLARWDGATWRLTGQKIYVSWGDHDLTEQIVHFVLARTEGAPAGTKGLSLFIVPKQLVQLDGISRANDVRTVSIEHKMGIRASPTCTMVLGEREGAVGALLGNLHGGLTCLFSMMNSMRLGVAMQSVGVAERALQLALTHAMERRQGRDASGALQAIIEHADVRRMLLTMRALTRGIRLLVYAAAAQIDLSEHAIDEAARSAAARRARLLTPLAKAFCSDTAIEVASLGVQIHGGAGYIDEAEISQIYRDARIGPIFEGTNYMQAQDLLFRNVVREGGTELFAILDDLERQVREIPDHPQLRALQEELAHSCIRLREAALRLLNDARERPEDLNAVAYPFLTWFGLLFSGCQLARSASRSLRRGEHDPAARSALEEADFFATHILPRARGLEPTVHNGARSVLATGMHRASDTSI